MANPAANPARFWAVAECAWLDRRGIIPAKAAVRPPAMAANLRRGVRLLMMKMYHWHRMVRRERIRL